MSMEEAPVRVLTVEQAAQRLRLAADRVWRLATSGELQPVPGTWPPRFRDQEVEACAGRMAYEAGCRSRNGRLAQDKTRQPRPQPRAPGDDQALTLTKAATLLGVGEQALRAFIASGELATVGSPPRIRRRDLDAYVERCRIQPGELRASPKRRAR